LSKRYDTNNIALQKKGALSQSIRVRDAEESLFEEDSYFESSGVEDENPMKKRSSDPPVPV
jgi:hypothetical protein